MKKTFLFLIILAKTNPLSISLAEHRHDHVEENSQVGSNKGGVEAHEEDGMKLSPEAESNFGVKRQKVQNLAVSISKSAIVRSGEEKNLYRYRNGFYKRIDFEIISKTAGDLVIRSHDLKVGDEIATGGLGFLLTAEIAAFGGAPEGHSH